jgi:hypothetical protein
MNADPATALPPAWAEALLRLLLKADDRESVSGDLLEEYRESMVASRGRQSAEARYIRQVAGFVWRATWPWALLFSGQFIARTAYDWFVPTHDFHARAAFSTYFGATTFFLVGLWAARRSRSLLAGTVMTLVTSHVAALFSVTGATLMLAIWHDPETQRAIVGSGGFGEVCFLPFAMMVPALILGTVGGAAGLIRGIRG